MNFYDDSFIDDLRKELPPIFTRETASKLTGGIFSPKTLSNFDAAGRGPRRKQHIGKKVAYLKEDFLDWLQGMITIKPNQPKTVNHIYW